MVRNAAALMRPEEGAAFGLDQLSRIAAELPVGDTKEGVRRLKALYTPPGTPVDAYVALGAWSKAAFLAASAQDDKLFGTSWFNQTGKSLTAGPYPKEAVEATRNILELTERFKDQFPYGRVKVQVRRIEDLL